MPGKKAAALVLAVMAAGALILTGCTPESNAPGAEESADLESAAVGTSEPTARPTPEPTPTPAPEPTPEPTPTPRAELDYEAQELSGTMTVTVPGQGSVSKLLDANYETKLSLPAGTEIGLAADSEITALYLIWDQAPGEWSAECGSFSERFGTRGFIHEYVELPQGTDSLTITLSNGAILCDIYAFTDGRLPDYVQTWEDPVERADILLFSTHGDDEHLFFGSVMPYYAGELGLSVQVVYLTNHWAEPVRPHEQLNGLWTVGMTAYPVFSGFKDRYAGSLSAALNIYGEDPIVAFQVEMIRRFRPQVIVDHDVNGEYGHGVHILNTYCVKKAVEYAADETYDGGSLETCGVWDTPKLYIHMQQENHVSLDYDRPLERFGGRTAYEMAIEGYACHLSQHRYDFFVYPKGHRYDCSSFGLYRSTVGEDTAKNDLMENLTPYRDQ